jgi:hypothetical protein
VGYLVYSKMFYSILDLTHESMVPTAPSQVVITDRPNVFC